MSKLIDMTGQKFGRLRVTGRGPAHIRGRAQWQCLCDCGRMTIVQGVLLRRGQTTSCGCAKREGFAARLTKHGQARGPQATEYRTWKAIKNRCSNPNGQDWEHYGGRGITVCDRWRDDFAAFLADMGPKPSPRHSIDRRDVNLGYTPSNCVWATQVQQTRNTRRNRMLTFQGQTRCLSAWAEAVGLKRSVLQDRIGDGWTAERALTTPVRR